MTVLFDVPGTSRRVFLGTAAAAAGSALLPAIAAPAAKYTRYNATSPQGRAMLVSYERGVQKLLKYDAGDSRNWFRNAFIHAMDCPHGNWWFFTLAPPLRRLFRADGARRLGQSRFRLSLLGLDGGGADSRRHVLRRARSDERVLQSLYFDLRDVFEYLNPAMTDYWKTLSPAQLAQLQTRGMPTLASLWQQVKDFEQSAMYAQTPYARYLTKANPWLDDKTKVTVSLPTILKGLAPNTFDTFNSNETPSHNTAPSGTTVFAILEGQPHNKTHNNLGGVGHIPNDQYLKFGYMADNLSPVDPVFFLHHSNMDRLWDVWTRKQQARRLPWLPTGTQWPTFAKEPFLFYADRMGKPAPRKTAGEAIPIGDFDYAYQPGSGEQIVTPVAAAVAALKPFVGAVSAGAGAVSVPQNLLQGGTLVASITIPHPMSGASPRDYDVLVNAPPGTTHVEADSPYYAGTVSFFGFMAGMMAMDVTFQVPLTKLPAAAKGKAPGDLVFTVVPSYASPNLAAAALGRNGPAPLLKAVSVAVSP
ncbi:MAG: tyrosinase family protein [Rhizomicrobium sp.]